MNHRLTWRVGAIIVFFILSVVYMVPTIVGELPSWWKLLPKEKIHLGLDLQGGTHLVMKVETEAAVSTYLDRIVGTAEEVLNSERIPFKAAKLNGQQVVVSLYSGDDTSRAEKSLKQRLPEINVASDTSGTISLSLDKVRTQDLKDKAVAQALETIRNRIDQFGVTEPVIQREGADHIIVQLPGVKDPKRAIELIGKTARLEFKLVDESVIPATASPSSLPEDDELLVEKRIDVATGTVTELPLVLKKKAVITGDLLTDAQVSIDQFGRPYVAINFNAPGARIFDQITAGNIGKRFAIVLDNTVYSAPVIQERISGGSAQISGSFSEKEASDLAIVLRAGALPAPVEVIQNVTVGPSLGQDSINKGLLAGGVGVVLVVTFMVFYYRFAGLVANIGMALNVIFLVGALAALGATLTLPGIAGIVLLIGMSVDSNVLIFERIKEELRLGRLVGASIEGGYDKAFLTIMDSHVTTLITAAVLFQFGTGPVKGFAVSLSLGVIINLFTSLVATKVIFDALLRSGRMNRLNI